VNAGNFNLLASSTKTVCHGLTSLSGSNIGALIESHTACGYDIGRSRIEMVSYLSKYVVSGITRSA